MGSLWHPLVYPSRLTFPPEISAEDVQAFIESRSREHAGKLEDEFAARALTLGIESGIVLDVGTRAGLIALKISGRTRTLLPWGSILPAPL
jgi:hypothetical protein